MNASAFLCSKEHLVSHKNHVFITEREILHSKRTNIVKQQRTSSHRYPFERTYLYIFCRVGRRSKLMLWISSYAIGSVASPLETVVECSERRIKPHITMNRFSRTNANQTQIAFYSGGSRAIVGWRTLPTNDDAPFGSSHVSRSRAIGPIVPETGGVWKLYCRQTARQNSDTQSNKGFAYAAAFLVQCFEDWAKELFF